MKKLNQPKVISAYSPFVNGYTDIEKDYTNVMIGISDIFEDALFADFPDYLNVLCSISSKADFQDITISARYREQHNGEIKQLSYKLYDNSVLNTSGFVAELAIEVLDILPGQTILDVSFQTKILEQKTIYIKKFPIQQISKNIDNFIDRSIDESDIIHTKSNAHCFAGSYFSEIKLSDIQPYLFFVGTGARAMPYISLISARDVLQTKQVKIDPMIKPEELSTLEDDICNGKVLLDCANELFCYKSIAAKKDTLVSNVFHIIFKKEIKNG
jgi:hypothetical protein